MAHINIGEFIDISGYIDTYYTTDLDGYAYVSGSNIILQVWGRNSNYYVPIQSTQNNAQVAYVRKGMRIKLVIGSGLTAARFYRIIIT